MSSPTLNVTKEGDSKTLLSNLFQYLSTLMLIEFLHMFKHNNCCLLLHALSVCTFSTLHQVFIQTGKTPQESFVLQAKQYHICHISALPDKMYALIPVPPSWPFSRAAPIWSCLTYWGTQNWTHHSRAEAMDDLPWPADDALSSHSNEFRVLLAFFARRRQICTVSVVILLCDYIVLYYRTRAGFWKSLSSYAEIFIAKSSQLSGQLYLVQGCRVN